MKKTLFKALLLTSFLSSGVQAGTMGEKHQIYEGTEKVSAQVEKIDYKSREITLKDEGDSITFVADEAVKNLKEIKKGDFVNITYKEALAYQLNRGGEAAQAMESTDVKTSEQGSKPEANVSREIKGSVVITNIDKKENSVTFKNAKGETETVKVKHPERLNEIKVGDAIDITYTQALAMKVEKTKAKM